MNLAYAVLLVIAVEAVAAVLIAGLFWPRFMRLVSTRITLTEDDFEALVSGEEVARLDARIILADIGYGTMIRAIRRAEAQE